MQNCVAFNEFCRFRDSRVCQIEMHQKYRIILNDPCKLLCIVFVVVVVVCDDGGGIVTAVKRNFIYTEYTPFINAFLLQHIVLVLCFLSHINMISMMIPNVVTYFIR